MLPEARRTYWMLKNCLEREGEISWECLALIQTASFPKGQRAAEFLNGNRQIRKRSVITRVMSVLQELERSLHDWEQDRAELNAEEERSIPDGKQLMRAIRRIAWKPFVCGHADRAFLLRDLIEQPDALATVPTWQREPFLRHALLHVAPGGSSSAWVTAARAIGMSRACVAGILREQARLQGAGAIVFSCPHRVIRAAAILCPFVGFADKQAPHVLATQDLEAMRSAPWAQFDNDELLSLVRSLLPSQPTEVMNLCNVLILRFGIRAGLDLLTMGLTHHPSFDDLSWGATFFLHWLPDSERIPLLLRLTEAGEPRTPRRLSFLITVLGSIEQQSGEAPAEALLDQLMRWNENDERRFCLTVSLERFEKIAAEWYGDAGLPAWMRRRLDHARALQTTRS